LGVSLCCKVGAGGRVGGAVLFHMTEQSSYNSMQHHPHGTAKSPGATIKKHLSGSFVSTVVMWKVNALDLLHVSSVSCYPATIAAPNQKETPLNQLDDLLAIMAKLRDPEKGCPWDLKQDFASIVPHTLEEAYEVAETIETGNFAELKDELGDLLFQVVFYSQLALEEDKFNFADVTSAICEKLIRRHPHIFSDKVFTSDEQIHANWEKEKAKERQQKSVDEVGLLANVPHNLPALTRANKLQKRCATVGFEWPDVKGALLKVKEEIEEVEQELARPDLDHDAIGEELGDLFFALVNVTRYLKHDPETIVRAANRKFERRFEQVEAMTKRSGKTLQGSSLEEMDALWEEVKVIERK
jgi:ATP diphosphatase